MLLTTDGTDVPVIELVEVVFNAGAVEPEQKGLITSKVVVTFGVTVTEAVVELAHEPASGVKVYDAEFKLSPPLADQVPAIEFVEVVANTGAVVPEQNAGTVAKVGVVVTAVTVTD